MSMTSLYAYKKTTVILNVYRFRCQVVLCIVIIASFSFDVFVLNRMPQRQGLSKVFKGKRNTFSLQSWSDL